MGTFGFPSENAYDELIWAAGRKHGVDPLLVKAVIAQESGFRSNAYRAEPRINDASRGLMQVLYRTAQSQLGYSGTPDGMFDPATSIDLGTKYLAWQQERYQRSPRQLTDTIAAYNAGTAYYNELLGLYDNQAYVTSVFRYYQGYHDAESQSPPSMGGTPTAEILREQPPAPASPDIGSVIEQIWIDLTRPFSPEPLPSPAPDGVTLPTPSEEGASWYVWAGLALLGIAGALAFARGR